VYLKTGKKDFIVERGETKRKFGEGWKDGANCDAGLFQGKKLGSEESVKGTEKSVWLTSREINTRRSFHARNGRTRYFIYAGGAR